MNMSQLYKTCLETNKDGHRRQKDLYFCILSFYLLVFVS